ncbi:uncharacterized protein [Amphiura filiformis]|uniref:uncharacterized protein n=1 Tax=Amphiura filiformis TaxID=82378 RepID=UPI003B214B38
MAEEINLDNLEFHEQLGEGAYGTVNRVTFKTPFKGYHKAAAKSIHSIGIDEIDIMRKLNHPHIVKLLAFYKKGPINMIILEYAPNRSLHDYLADHSQPLPIDLKLSWMKQAGLAIEYLHASNFIHRDIKARNCLLFQDNVLKICDFGLARAIHHSQSSSSIKGTYCYMAPEIHVGNERGRSVYSKPADIYAYGMLMLEIFIRKPPFDGFEWQMVIFRVGSGEQPDIPATCPKVLAEIMRCCWNANPRRRPTIQDILQGHPFNTTENQARESTARLFHKSQTLPQDLQEPQAAGEQETDTWKVVKTITPTHYGRSLKAHTIACCPNEDVVVSYWDPGQVFLYGSDGECKMQLTSPDVEEKQIGYVMGIAVSPQGFFIVSLYSRFVQVFNLDGTYHSSFSILAADENPNTQTHPKCVAIDREGHVLVGDWQRKVITIHTCPDGKQVRRVRCSNFEDRMTVNSKNQILYSCKSPKSVYDQVVAIDYSGNEVFTLTPRVDEDMTPSIDQDISDCRRVSIEGIVCDSHDVIYIVMQVCKGYGTMSNTGHLHQYTPTGGFLRCIDRGIDDPHDLTIASNQSLILQNHESILVYSTK